MHSAGSTIYDLLIADHALVMSALDGIEKITDPDRCKDVFSFVRTELIMHSKAEEEVFYRPLREAIKNGAIEADNDLIKTSFDDHDEIEHLLMDIQLSSAHDNDWIEKIRELRSVIKHHVIKEETDLFHLAKTVFSTEEAEDIAIRMMEKKANLSIENPHALFRAKAKEVRRRA
jgi:hemerythrin superfamily protein